jgi:hypothetical protein
MLSRRSLVILAMLFSVAGLSACDERLNPTRAGIRLPPVDVSSIAGAFDLVGVDGQALPHTTTAGGTNYSLVSGTFALNADSTWLYSSTEVLTGTNGQLIGNSPANYQGKWTVTDSTVNILAGYGFIRMKGDTLFWRGGPRHSWEDSLTFTLVRK